MPGAPPAIEPLEILDVEQEGWKELAAFTGGVPPEQVDALVGVHDLEPLYPLLRMLVGRSPRDFFIRAAVVEALVSADEATFSTEALKQVLYWLDPAVRESTLRLLRQSGWLVLEPGIGTWVSDAGRWANDVLSFLHRRLRESDLLPTVAGVEYAIEIGADPLHLLHSMRSRLVSLRDALESARASYSEVVLRREAHRLHAALELSAQIRAVLARVPLDQRAARVVARDIHELVSELHGKSAEVHQSLVELGQQYLRLASGMTTEQIVNALMRLPLRELTQAGHDALLPVLPAPPLVTTEVLASAAEQHLLRDRKEKSQVTWDEPPPPMEVSGSAVAPAEVLSFLDDLAAIVHQEERTPLATLVPRTDKTTSFLRASLLALVGQGLSGEGIAGQLGALPLSVTAEGEGWPVELTDGGESRALVAITRGSVGRREGTNG